MESNRYITTGDIIMSVRTHDEYRWAIILRSSLGGGGAPYKVIKYPNFKDEHSFLNMCESVEGGDLYGWKKVTNAELVLNASPETVNKLMLLKKLIKYGYRGKSYHTEMELAEMEWRFNDY